MKCVIEGVVLVSFLFYFAGAEQQATSQYEDVRCKCVCPTTLQNGTEQPNVFIGVFEEPSLCTCENVVKNIPRDVPNYCDSCQCEWQRRNTTTIKVVVIIIILVMSLLVLYMLFLLCLDPLMSRRPKAYLEQRNEEDTQSVTQQMPDDVGPRARRGPIISRMQHQVNRAKGEQEKWKGTVQEQRRNVYDRHTMLN